MYPIWILPEGIVKGSFVSAFIKASWRHECGVTVSGKILFLKIKGKSSRRICKVINNLFYIYKIKISLANMVSNQSKLLKIETKNWLKTPGMECGA